MDMNFTREISVEFNLTCVIDCPVKNASFLQILLFVIGILGLILNVLVFYGFWFSHTPPTRWSLTNLGIGTIFAFNISLFHLLKDLGYFILDYPPACKNWGFFERVPLAILPPTMLTLFHESAQHGKVYQNPKKSMRANALIFLISFLISIPGFFNNKVTLGSGEYENVRVCWKIFFAEWKIEDGNIFWYFNGMDIQIIYETIFIIGISLPPSFFMIYILHDMKFDMRWLYLFEKVPPQMKCRVKKVRWALAYVFFYHICYLLPACIRFGLTISVYYGDSPHLDGHWRQDADNTKLGKECWVIMNYFLVVLHPIFFAQLRSLEAGQKTFFCFDWMTSLRLGQQVEDIHNIQIDILHVV